MLTQVNSLWPNPLLPIALHSPDAFLDMWRYSRKSEHGSIRELTEDFAEKNREYKKKISLRGLILRSLKQDCLETVYRRRTVELVFCASSRWIVARSQVPSASSISSCVPVRYNESRVSPLGDSGI